MSDPSEPSERARMSAVNKFVADAFPSSHRERKLVRLRELRCTVRPVELAPPLARVRVERLGSLRCRDSRAGRNTFRRGMKQSFGSRGGGYS
jgi:hypothetical protein